MLVFKAFHIIAMVAWMAGLFYLPRLFVYHATAMDTISIERFKLMEKRLYYGIAWPSGVATALLGFSIVMYYPAYYFHSGWFHAKLALVILLWVYHLSCGHFLKNFAANANSKSARFFRIYNELPLLLLLGIVFLVVLKPF